ncbi:hypothetical protein C7212DRAFT_365309 [Tuber magnatum]|uniref:RNA polymerase II subunit B1 CTD phosphatase RPAP2 homolog n=1 Tax=Tuber magnatum TaxID=42249 RepID=A0A317SLE7_9PEZI|nr:hypothetical protein C7212DRAFT_365309 [Tuber magnatum]
MEVLADRKGCVMKQRGEIRFRLYGGEADHPYPEISQSGLKRHYTVIGQAHDLMHFCDKPTIIRYRTDLTTSSSSLAIYHPITLLSPKPPQPPLLNHGTRIMTAKQPKSILKKTREPSSSATTIVSSTIAHTGPPASQSKPLPTPEEARAIALSHAHSIQIRKVLELSILTSLEQLVDFPLPDSTSTDLKCHLRYFRPSDFDSLIEERGICDKCSYPLCPNPPKRLAGGGKSTYALVNKGKKTMRFVEKEKLERFCSDICARQGLWLRVQLNTEPAWTRAEIIRDVQVDSRGAVLGLDLTGEKWRGGFGTTILLLEEAEEQRRQAKWNNTKEADIEKLAEELMEVGISLDKETRGLKQSDSLSVDIKERKNEAGMVKPPELILTDENGDRARSIEGYTPKIGPVYARKISTEKGG